jgi:hypothetical protein
MSTAQSSTPTGFERVATSAWRSVRRFLPTSVAEAIRKPLGGHCTRSVSFGAREADPLPASTV